MESDGLAVQINVLDQQVRHFGQPSTRVFPGSGKTGRLLVDPAGPASTAADTLADTPGIRNAHAKVMRDRGELVVAITGTVDPSADLSEVVAAADAVTTDLQAVLGRDDARARVRLSVARKDRARMRVA